LGMLQADLYTRDDMPERPEDEETANNGRKPRAKRMDYQHFIQLRRSLRVLSRSQSVEYLIDWLDAGIHTGLRPVEWSMTSLERRSDSRLPNGERIWLHVINAKAADGRGTHRTLDLSNFSPDTLEAVERMVQRSREWVLTDKAAKRQWDVSRLLRDSCRVLFPRMKLQYTVYSLRHQFIANMKTIYSREELAAMVGHISLDTQVDHYGKRRSSWSKFEITEIPMPVEEQVTHIRKRIEMFDERRSLMALKAAASASASDQHDDEFGYAPGDEDLDDLVDTKSSIDRPATVTAADVDPTTASS
jgi:hypothetical protein